MSRSVLLTAAIEDTEIFRSQLEEHKATPLHYPLERYQPLEADEEILETLEELDEYENIVHGSKRNARYFVEKVSEYDKLDVARNRLNLALNQHTANFLEEQGVPAVHPHSDGKAIDLMEFMLRVRRIGKTLYPCGDKTAEDLPGFLRELDVPVEELVLFTLEGPEDEALREYRKELAAHKPAVIVFHSRRSVNRTLAAFPNLNYSDAHVISAAQAITEKLEAENIEVDAQAEGSWDSVLEEVLEALD